MALEDIRHLRDDHSDDIPDQKAFGNFKVRRAWWQELFFGLEDLYREGLIPDDLKPEVDGFIQYYTSDEFHAQPLTTAEDINRANGLINKILGRK